MATNDIPPITLKADPQSQTIINALTKQLGVGPSELFSKSLALFQMAQGRKVVLKGKDGSWEINDFTDKQIQVKFNQK